MLDFYRRGRRSSMAQAACATRARSLLGLNDRVADERLRG
jgi:hypothetical protein